MNRIRVWFVVVVCAVSLCAQALPYDKDAEEREWEMRWQKGGNAEYVSPEYIPIPEPGPWHSFLDQKTGIWKR